VKPRSSVISAGRANCSVLGTGKGRKTNALTPLKIAVLAPIPRARVNTATMLTPGFFNSMRAP